MLQLRPSCEHCNKGLAPDASDAMICSFECTFCTHCVETVLQNVCPNCGGGFCSRPVRPAINLMGGNCLINHPASTKVIHRPVDEKTHQAWAQKIKSIEPQRR